MKRFSRIVLVRSNQAHLPEIEGYKGVLETSFPVKVVGENELLHCSGLDTSLVWYFMGFYPRRIDAAIVIHDYRSLSTGAFRRVKDRLKRVCNAKPDCRIFLNETLMGQMGFRDNTSTYILDMGVPECMFEHFNHHMDKKYDFCYVGVISKMRNSEKILNAFLKSEYSDKRFILVGSVDPEIKRHYSSYPNILFSGIISQSEVFNIVNQSHYAISHIPSIKPYIYQTPTKLLEYGALGGKIIANRCMSNEVLAHKMGLNVRWTDESVFASLDRLDGIENNFHIDSKNYTWEKNMSESGILEFLNSRFRNE